MKNKILTLLILMGLSVFATANSSTPLVAAAPQPTTCVTGTFTATGTSWKNVALTIKNNCATTVDFQNATITFNNSSNLNTTFWGTFNPLSYPTNNLVITSQPNGAQVYLSTLSLQFSSESWSNTKLTSGQSFIINYGQPTATFDSSSLKVYLTTTPPSATGAISLTNASAKPASVSQAYAIIDVTSGAQQITKVQLPWSGSQSLTGLTPGSYTVQPENLSDNSGNSFQGVAQPSSVTVTANGITSSTVTYNKVTQVGNISFAVAPMPSQLSGYNNSPSVTLTNTSTQSSVVQSLPWNTQTTISQLVNNTNYSFSTPLITYNGYRCTGIFNPTSATSSITPPTVQLSYQCVQVAQDIITLNVKGLPSTTSSVVVTFTPTTGSAITQTIPISNGSGTNTVNLTDGMVYNVISTNVTGYSASFSPQPLTAALNGIETISYAANTVGNGRIIGYLPGWLTPPSPASMANAGYTNILVAFGVFSTSSPGAISNAFSTVTTDYITQLHNAGLKVSLSLGGASSSIANTTVNFHEVLTAAPSQSAFVTSFVQSVESLVSQYGFDGIDFDIEQGFNAGGTFANPTGDIAALAAIINKLRADNPNLIISLAPQAANISATSGFDNTWGNYSSLIMQTYNALTWVGVQNYNTGCVFGINQICYGTTASPDFSVAVAVDMLASWPSKNSAGQSTGFQPYIGGLLKPSQIVLGYPAPDNTGASDGSPVTPTAAIIRAFQCLQTGIAGSNSCDTYVPPQAYPGIGGVFEWQLIYDEANNFKFASSLKNCVRNGICS